MSRVQLEILPWVTIAFGSQKPGCLVIEESIEAGTTVGDLMRKLAGEYEAFRNIVFDVRTHQLSGDVAVALNDQFLEALAGLNTSLKDGDVIRLFPVIAGG